VLVAPERRLLAPNETKSSRISATSSATYTRSRPPSGLARFPQARSARSIVIDLEPGDALFLRLGWWHQVRSLSFSVMLIYTIFIWPNDAHVDFPLPAVAIEVRM
jgi:hypothetical protein